MTQRTMSPFTEPPGLISRTAPIDDVGKASGGNDAGFTKDLDALMVLRRCYQRR